MVFDGTETIGLRGGVSSALNTALTGNTWTIAILIKQSTLTGDWLSSFAHNGVQLSISFRTNASGNAILFYRQVDGAAATELISTTSFSVDTETVLIASLKADGDITISIDGGVLTTVSTTVDVSGATFEHISLGSFNRNGIGSYWAGDIIEHRLYDTDETDNRVAITAEMLAGSSTPPTLDDVDTDEILVDAQQGFDVTTSDFAGGITSFKIALGSDETDGTIA